jgi:hypothetical protein
MIGMRQVADCRPSGVERLPAPKNGVENLKRCPTSADPFNAWHVTFQ